MLKGEGDAKGEYLHREIRFHTGNKKEVQEWGEIRILKL